MKIMTFNIRFWNERDGLQSWENRKPYFFQILEKYLPDIVGFQEVQPIQMEDLISFLCKQHGYNLWAFNRSDGDIKSEGCPIFYRNLTPAEKGIFWLSNTPERPSKHFGKHKRQCVWLQFKAPEPFVVMNTHLDHLSSRARIKGLNVLKEQISKFITSTPVILMGDFNFSPESREYRYFLPFMKDAYLIDEDNNVKDEVTFHNFSGQTQYLEKKRWGKVINQRIDYIWVFGGIFVNSCQIIFEMPNHDNPPIYPSDHWPVMADISLYRSKV